MPLWWNRHTHQSQKLTGNTMRVQVSPAAPITNLLLKDVDEEYRTTLINFAKYKLVMFAMAKLMEMETTEQNKVALYLFNCIT